MTSPAITFRTRLLDLMAPGITRPFASTTLGDIIALAHRLGMRWIDLRPEDGNVWADGQGQAITSIVVSGFGILI